jgi:lysozyme
VTEEPLLRLHANGPAVLRLQRALSGAGFNPGPGDGIFGPRTLGAVQAFQRARRLAVDGVVGPITWNALLGGAPLVHPAEPKKAGPRTLSSQGAAFIARFEGFRGQLYEDAAGHCTIGYGHLVHLGHCNGSEPAEFKKGVSQQRALAILQQDAATAAAAVNRDVGVALTQPQFDALVSFVFNVGGGNFQASTLLKELNAGHVAAVPGQLARWNSAGGQVLQGLVNRRRAEGELFSHGTY